MHRRCGTARIRPRLIAQRRAQCADQADGGLGALQIAAEPEQIVGGAARQHAGDAADADGVDRRQQGRGRNSLVGDHPDVGGHRAVTHRYRARIGPIGDPAEAAGQHGPAIRRCRREHPEHEGTRRDPAVLPHRRRGQPHQLLADIVDAAVADRIPQAVAVRRRQFARQHRTIARKVRNAAAIGALDRELVEPRQHLFAGGLLAAPPRRDVRHHQVFGEQTSTEIGQEAEQRPRLQHAGAWHVGDHDATLAQHLDEARHAEIGGRVELERIEHVGIDPPQQHVEPLQPGDGADVDAIAGDGEIIALDQEEAEIAGERGVLEIGLAERARREQTNPRFVAIGAGAK